MFVERGADRSALDDCFEEFRSSELETVLHAAHHPDLVFLCPITPHSSPKGILWVRKPPLRWHGKAVGRAFRWLINFSSFSHFLASRSTSLLACQVATDLFYRNGWSPVPDVGAVSVNRPVSFVSLAKNQTKRFSTLTLASSTPVCCSWRS